jgi:hypothetical protein
VPRRLLAALSLGLLAALLLGSAAIAGVPGFGAAKKPHRYSVYWAGEEALGLPLESVEDLSPGSIKTGRTYFGYGDCEPSGADHPSCALPMQVQSTSGCVRWASRLRGKGERLTDFRGAKALWHRGLPLEGGGEGAAGPLEIFTGRTTVVIAVNEGTPKERETRAFAVARLLRTVHESKPPAKLPPPALGSLAGKLPCQKD